MESNFIQNRDREQKPFVNFVKFLHKNKRGRRMKQEVMCDISLQEKIVIVREENPNLQGRCCRN